MEYLLRKREPGDVELRYFLACFDREFIIKISKPLANIAYKIIEESYLHWCEDPEDVGDVCCEEYIHGRLNDCGIIYVPVDEY